MQIKRTVIGIAMVAAMVGASGVGVSAADPGIFYDLNPATGRPAGDATAAATAVSTTPVASSEIFYDL